MGVSAQSRTEAPLRSGTAARAGLLVLVSIVVIVLASVGGLVIGSRNIPVSTVLDAVLSYDAGNNEHLIVIESRLPRTILGLVVGAALGLAGALMQSITRNPLADPGLLGVNAGASAAVVVAIAYLGVTSVGSYLWFALAGAAVASVGVYMLGSAHRSAATPARMALAGAAVATAIMALTSMVLISNEAAFNQFRFWAVGSLQGRGGDVIVAVLPFVIVGIVLSLLLIRPLNAIALGEDVAKGLGASTGPARVGSAVAVILLAGAATCGGWTARIRGPGCAAHRARCRRAGSAISSAVRARCRPGISALGRRSRSRCHRAGRSADGDRRGGARWPLVCCARSLAAGGVAVNAIAAQPVPPLFRGWVVRIGSYSWRIVPRVLFVTVTISAALAALSFCHADVWNPGSVLGRSMACPARRRRPSGGSVRPESQAAAADHGDRCGRKPRCGRRGFPDAFAQCSRLAGHHRFHHRRCDCSRGSNRVLRRRGYCRPRARLFSAAC